MREEEDLDGASDHAQPIAKQLLSSSGATPLKRARANDDSAAAGDPSEARAAKRASTNTSNGGARAEPSPPAASLWRAPSEPRGAVRTKIRKAFELYTALDQHAAAAASQPPTASSGDQHAASAAGAYEALLALAKGARACCVPAGARCVPAAAAAAAAAACLRTGRLRVRPERACFLRRADMACPALPTRAGADEGGGALLLRLASRLAPRFLNLFPHLTDAAATTLMSAYQHAQPAAADAPPGEQPQGAGPAPVVAAEEEEVDKNGSAASAAPLVTLPALARGACVDALSGLAVVVDVACKKLPDKAVPTVLRITEFAIRCVDHWRGHQSQRLPRGCPAYADTSAPVPARVHTRAQAHPGAAAAAAAAAAPGVRGPCLTQRPLQAPPPLAQRARPHHGRA